MKIIATSNFDNESVSDLLIAENINEYYSILIADYFNSRIKYDDKYFYKPVMNDYKLYKFEP